MRPENLVAYPSPSGERSLNSALRKGYEFTSIAAISRNDGVIRTRKTMILACLVTTAMNTKGFDARMRTAGRGANRASESRNWARMDRWMCMNSPSGSNMFVVYQGDHVNNNQWADSLIRDSGAIRERNGRFFVVRPDDRPQRSLSLSPNHIDRSWMLCNFQESPPSHEDHGRRQCCHHEHQQPNISRPGETSTEMQGQSWKTRS